MNKGLGKWLHNQHNQTVRDRDELQSSGYHKIKTQASTVQNEEGLYDMQNINYKAKFISILVCFFIHSPHANSMDNLLEEESIKIIDNNGRADTLFLSEHNLDDVVLRSNQKGLYIYILEPDNPEKKLKDLRKKIRIKDVISEIDTIETLSFMDGFEINLRSLTMFLSGFSDEDSSIDVHLVDINWSRYENVDVPRGTDASKLLNWINTNQPSSKKNAKSIFNSHNSPYQLDVYEGKIFLKAGITYSFKEDVDDVCLLLIDNQHILFDNDDDNEAVVSYKTSKTGYVNFKLFSFNDIKKGASELYIKEEGSVAYRPLLIAPLNEKLQQNVLETSMLLGDHGDNYLDAGPSGSLLIGDRGHDILHGRNGEDALFSGEDNDLLFGGSGDDVLSGGNGNDTYVFLRNYGHDRIFEKSGIDTVKFRDGITRAELSLKVDQGDLLISLQDQSSPQERNNPEDVIRIKKWSMENPQIEYFEFADATIVRGEDILNETLTTFGENDTLQGGDGNDILKAGSGSDSLYGGKGDDQLFGEEGNDLLKGGDGSDLLDGGDGTDWVSYSEYKAKNEISIIDLYAGIGSHGISDGDSYKSIENAAGSEGPDHLIGSNENNILLGLNGDDILDGGKGNDQLYGGKGRDVFKYTKSSFAHDVIKDFSTDIGSSDIIQFDAIVFKNVESVFAAMHIIGNDTVIRIDSKNSITLQGIPRSELDNRNFQFQD